LVRGAVITGKVTDPDGHPVIETWVTLVNVQPPNQPGSSYNIPQGQTDDRGIYRIFGIHAGSYKVVVHDNHRWSRGGPPVMPATYYPDVQAADKATIVDVTEGGEVSNIDIKIGPVLPGFSIAGRVVDENGNPVPNFNIHLSRTVVVDANRNGTEYTGATSVSDAHGKFRIPNVPPGKYEVSVWGGEDSDQQLQSPVRFEVMDADVTDLVIKTARVAQVSGVVIFDGTKKPAGEEPMSQVSVIAYSRGEGEPGFSWAGGARVKADRSFVINGVRPGILSFRLAGQNGNHNGFLLTRVERDGIIQTNGIQIEGTQHLTGLRLFVTSTNGSINGVVKIANGTLPPGARVMVQLSRAEEPNLGFSGGEVDARGHFLIEGLAAGNYELSVVAYVPNQRGRPSITKQPVTVGDGAATDVTVILDLTPHP
jgi:Carboxypeptidase regulatory-like domain